eukprot:COSAG01_NODE_48722_length_378_cov_2.046595_1_plen_74_part_10
MPKAGGRLAGGKQTGGKVATVRKKESASKRRVKKQAGEKERKAALTKQCVLYCLRNGVKGKSGIASARDKKKFE